MLHMRAKGFFRTKLIHLTELNVKYENEPIWIESDFWMMWQGTVSDEPILEWIRISNATHETESFRTNQFIIMNLKQNMREGAIYDFPALPTYEIESFRMNRMSHLGRINSLKWFVRETWERGPFNSFLTIYFSIQNMRGKIIYYESDFSSLHKQRKKEVWLFLSLRY